MIDTEKWLQVFALAKVKQAPQILKEWYSMPGLIENYRSCLADSIDRLQNKDLAQKFRKCVPIQGTSIEEYQTRLLSLPGLGETLTGIRFRGLDRNRPFVYLIASTEPLTIQNLQQCTNALTEEYQKFSPKHVQYFIPRDLDLDLNQVESHWDKCILAGPIKDLKEQLRPSCDQDLELHPAKDLSFIEQYQREYAQFQKNNPQHQEFAEVADQKALEQYFKENLLFLARINGDLAGIAAVEAYKGDGVYGYTVTEMFLFPKWQGRGLGALLNHCLIQHLPPMIGGVLHGSIHHENFRARKSAKRVGRQELGAYLWVNTRFA